MYSKEDYLMLSGIQHYFFCKRQWALIHIDQQWADNEDTAKGTHLHEKADKPYIKEKRKNTFISRAMPVSSKVLGFSGKLDVVEFTKDKKGIEIIGKKGLWWPAVIEYKKGKEKKDNRDVIQLVAQTICLEEALNINIDLGYLYYFETKRRAAIEITKKLRKETIEMSREMHNLYDQRKIPKAQSFKNCKLCSLIDLCLPRLTKKKKSVYNYLYGEDI